MSELGAGESATIGAEQIAAALGHPAPTPQQAEVIQSPLAPALVVAGAGSGKTETMSNRVLWLLANGHVTAGGILGLTFTRKAAGELDARIRRRITALADAGLVRDGYDPFDPPVVSTYNAFANGIYRDNALLLGRENDGAVLGEASAWQLARRVVIGCDDARLAGLDRGVDTITRAVLRLSRALGENLVDSAEVVRMAEDFAAIAELPAGGRGEYRDVIGYAQTVGALPVLIDLAAQYEREKLSRGFVEYSDQVALALRIVRSIPTVRRTLRERHPVVLLDEYQDTSVVQTWLLSEIFGKSEIAGNGEVAGDDEVVAHSSVMAVGDPHQSIYGWRGASAANMEQFATQFGAGQAHRFALSTSWRNGHNILAAANALVRPLTAASAIPVETLRPAETASSIPVQLRYAQTILDEADEAAQWLADALGLAQGDRVPTAAVLLRTRASQQVFLDAMKRAGVPYHVLGIGGLLAQPEIADLVSALSVVADPTAGTALVRLLAGARWRIGVRDLRGLAEVASWLDKRDWAQHPLEAEVVRSLRMSVAEGESASLADAVDFIARAPHDHRVLEGISETGRERMREAGAVFARLRSRAGMGLRDFVALVEQELLLDIETVANESMPLGRAAMEAFEDALTDYVTVSDSATLTGFLAWLREAEWRDRLSPRPEDPEPGTVQVLTVHGAKGLEWDHVVVPRLVQGEFPGTPNEGTKGWLGFGALPFEFRGDAAELPVFPWRTAMSRKEVKDEVALFSEQIAQRHRDEERRLAYVAVTRARHSLLLTGSFWAGQKKPRPPSVFLTELAEAGVIGPVPDTPVDEENPLGDEEDLIDWPRDPLGGRRARLERAAQVARAATPAPAGFWQRDIDLLLAERRDREGEERRVELPGRVPASRFKDYVSAPADVAASLARPMPERPYRATRLGTLFHRWVEERSGVTGSVEQLDGWVYELDDDAAETEPGTAAPDADADDAARLSGLIATFEGSRWAALRPVEVEREIHLPFEGRVIVCKIDAVYAVDGRYEVVDWKTGKPPADEADLRLRQLQLALYRLAYATWAGIDESLIDAYFYFVADDVVIQPQSLDDAAELARLWREAMAR